MRYIILVTLATLPGLVLAQTMNLQNLLANLIILVNNYIIPLLLGIAFIIFIWNAFRYFILTSNTTEGQENARYLALYGIAAFVLILSLWGIVNLVINGVFGSASDPCIPTSDYVTDPYGVRSGTSCPPPPADVTISPDQPLTPTLPDTLPTLPSTSTPPVTLPPPITSTTTPPDEPVADYRPIRNFADAVRADADVIAYLAELTTNLGANTPSIVTLMFADLLGPATPGVTDYRRIVALLRLEAAGVISPDTVMDYTLLVNSYYSLRGDPLIDYAAAVIASTELVDVPTAVITNAADTRIALIKNLADQYSVTPGEIYQEDILGVAYFIDELHSTTKSPQQRWVYFMDNFYSFTDESVTESYRQNINSEILLQQIRNRYNFIN